jgi:hypothetical protein
LGFPLRLLRLSPRNTNIHHRRPGEEMTFSCSTTASARATVCSTLLFRDFMAAGTSSTLHHSRGLSVPQQETDNPHQSKLTQLNAIMARLNPALTTQSNADPDTSTAAATKVNTTKVTKTEEEVHVAPEADRSTKTPDTNAHETNEEKTDKTKRFKPVISAKLGRNYNMRKGVARIVKKRGNESAPKLPICSRVGRGEQ